MTTPYDADAARELAGTVTRDVGGAFAVGLAYLGDKLGLFRALAQTGPCSAEQLASAATLHPRYVLEWARGMVATGWIEAEPGGGRFFLSPEQVAVFVDETSPTFAAGSFQFTLPSLLQTPRLEDHFREGGGIPFAELGEEVATSIDRMHRPWFDHLLTTAWLPAVPGLAEELAEGRRVLDVGCGLGRSTVAMAACWPASTWVGLDPHGPSIAFARGLAEERAVDVRFDRATLADHRPEAPYDVIVVIDCVHDLPDPVGALRRMGALLGEGGRIVWSEPTGSTDPLENRHPIARTRACLSTFHCLTVSLAQNGAGLGTIIGEDGARRLAEEAGLGFARLPIEHALQQFFELRRGPSTVQR